jgi:hypothetical protein
MTLQSARHRFGGSAVWLLGLSLAVALSGCDSVVDTYRSVSGMNKNDPDPATAPFTANLAKADTGSFPNLASVPLPPEVATSTADRTKLTESLTGARSSIEANGGTAAPGPVPPPPAVPPSIAAPDTTGLPPVQPPPRTELPPLRAQDEPPTPAPQNATLQTPAIASLPGVEKSRSSPQPGQPSAMPQPAPSELAPAAVQSGNPQPSPPIASLPPPKVEPQVAALPPPRLPPVPVTVASLDLAPGTAALPDDTHSRLQPVVAQYQEKPRTVRVVSYAVPGTGGAEQLNAFRAALDRAQMVAKELTDSGIPANKIQSEAAPAAANAPVGRIDVQLLPLP